MTAKFSYIHDINGFFAGALPVSDTIKTATLAQNTATPVTVPSDSGLGGNGITGKTTQWAAVINVTPAKEVWMSNGGTAAVPAGASFATSTSMMIPQSGALVYVKGGDVLSFITAATATSVSVSFYSIS